MERSVCPDRGSSARRWWALACVVALPALGAGVANEATDPSLCAAIAERQDALFSLALRIPPSTTVPRNLLRITLSQPVDPDTPAAILVPLLVRLAEGSSLADDGKNDTGFMRDLEVVEVLATALASPNLRIQQHAFQLLASRAPANLLQEAESLVRSALESLPEVDAIRLEAMLPTGPVRRTELLRRDDLAPEVRARLWDGGAEKALISEFRFTRDFQRMKELAQSLGYIGTERSVTALLEGLNSDLIDREPYQRVSIRYYIIEALGRAYPDEPLLTSEIRRIRNVGDHAYGAEELASYLEELAAWAQEETGVALLLEPLAVLYARVSEAEALAASESTDVEETRPPQ